MLRKLHTRRPRHGTVVAYLALFVAPVFQTSVLAGLVALNPAVSRPLGTVPGQERLLLLSAAQLLQTVARRRRIALAEIRLTQRPQCPRAESVQRGPLGWAVNVEPVDHLSVRLCGQ